MVVLLVMGAGAVVAALVAAAAHRWPAIEAPRLSETTIASEVVQHPKLASHLRRHFDPKTETGVALIVATAIVAAGAVGVGVVMAMVREKFGLQSMDVRLARYGADHATDFSTDTLRALTEFGGTRGVVLLAVAATLFEVRRTPVASVPAFMGVVIGGQFALSNGIKLLVERARPDISQLAGHAGTSFPSGHTTAAAASLAAIALIMTRRRSRNTKAAAAAGAAGLATIVAGTRVMLGVHWFTDTLAGLLLGWGWFALCSIAFGGRLLSFGRPVAEAEDVADDAEARPSSVTTPN